jgi:hypothetical protein
VLKYTPMAKKPDKQPKNRTAAHLAPWQFQPGKSGNPGGRPKGTVSLKTFAKKYLEQLTDEEKLEFMAGLDKDTVWKMAEGNPASSQEVSGKDGGPLEIKVVKFDDGDNATPPISA